MRAYILEGSARETGYSSQSAKIAHEILSNAGWELKHDRAFNLKAHYCLACEKCIDDSIECVQHDDMLGVYSEFMNADVLLFVTPVEFSSVPAQLKTVLDRCQRFYNRPFKREVKIPSYFIVFGGAKPYKDQFEIYPRQFYHLLKNISSFDAGQINFPATDQYGQFLPPETEAKVREFVQNIANVQ